MFLYCYKTALKTETNHLYDYLMDCELFPITVILTVWTINTIFMENFELSVMHKCNAMFEYN